MTHVQLPFFLPLPRVDCRKIHSVIEVRPLISLCISPRCDQYHNIPWCGTKAWARPGLGGHTLVFSLTEQYQAGRIKVQGLHLGEKVGYVVAAIFKDLWLERCHHVLFFLSDAAGEDARLNNMPVEHTACGAYNCLRHFVHLMHIHYMDSILHVLCKASNDVSTIHLLHHTLTSFVHHFVTTVLFFTPFSLHPLSIFRNATFSNLYVVLNCILGFTSPHILVTTCKDFVQSERNLRFSGKFPTRRWLSQITPPYGIPCVEKTSVDEWFSEVTFKQLSSLNLL